MTHAPIRLTVLAGAFDKTPAAEDDYHAWSDVADEIEAMARVERASKAELVAFNFARLREPYNVGANVEQVDALAIDVDRCDVGALLDAIDGRGIAALVYASPSDDPACDDARRVRVCAPVTRPIAPDEIKHARMAFAESIGIGPGRGVEGALDPSRIFFVGRVAGTPERACVRADGNPVDVDALLAAPLRHEWARKAAPSPRAAGEAIDVPADADDPLVPLLWAEYDAGGRREIVRALAGWFAKSGQPESRLLSIIAALPSDQVPARLALARETYAQAREGAVTAGWDALLSRVGSDAAPALETALAGLTWGPWWEAFTARRAKRRAVARTAPVVDTTAWATVPDEPLVLDRKKDGSAMPTQLNLARVLDHVFGDRIRYEECAGRVVVRGVDESLGRFPDGEWSDAHTTALVVLCDSLELHVSPSMADRGVELHAAKHSYNLLRDGLVAMAQLWDGVPRVDTALSVYWGAEDTPATRATSRVFLLSLAARGLEPGAKVDTCPILIGRQGIRKSSSLQALVGKEWFADSPLPIGDKDAAQAIRGKWLWEFQEHATISRREADQVKAFLSQRSDRFRASYGRHTSDVPRTCVFVSSSNEERILRDPTGARRFLPVHVTRVDLDAIERDRVQLLGEAAHRVGVLDEPWWPSAADDVALEPVREAATELDAWQDLIEKWLDKRDAEDRGPFEWHEVVDPFAGAIPMPADRLDKKVETRVTRTLTALGCVRGQQERIGGRRVRRWSRG